jgi:hypothetical protein|tara:strand:+ start:4106 stop:4420 length:315 start_codon:yes stop_codon:yes gene_type:complete
LIEELGIGRLQMTYYELYDLTPRVFWNAVDGYWDNQQTIDRKEWERVRWQTTCLINVQLPRGKQITIHKLIKFDWEKDDITNEMDDYNTVKKEYEKYENIKKLK